MRKELHLVDHYVYLPTKQAADDFARKTQRLGFTTEVTDADPRWLVIASRSTPLEGGSLDSDAEALDGAARDLGGTYDGYERSTLRRPPVPPKTM